MAEIVRALMVFLVFLVSSHTATSEVLVSSHTATSEDMDDDIDIVSFKISESVEEILGKFREENAREIPLKDRNITWKSRLPVTGTIIKKKLALSNGKISGLESIQRIGGIKHTRQFPYVNVNCTFSFTELTFASDFQKYFQKKKLFGGRARGNMKELGMDVSLKYSIAEPQTLEFTYISLKLTESINMRIENWKVIDWIISPIVKFFTKYSKTKILKLIEKQLGLRMIGRQYNKNNFKVEKV